MTKRILLLNVVVVCSALVALVGLAQLYSPFHQVLKDFTSIFLAIAAAYLTYCFQRRQAFLVALRDLWHKCVEAKAEILEYTYDPSPDRTKFLKANRALSMSIDLMRAAYRNVDETETSIGYYPFEPLHDMRKALTKLGYENVSDETQQEARRDITNAWNAFRWSFLREFSTPAPSHSITHYNAFDPRRN